MPTFMLDLAQHMHPRDRDEIPDVKKYFLDPLQADQYREQERMSELVDRKTAYPEQHHGIHINICQVEGHGNTKTFLCHACMTEDENLNLVYTFITIMPNVNQLTSMLLADFVQFVSGTLVGGMDTKQ